MWGMYECVVAGLKSRTTALQVVAGVCYEKSQRKKECRKKERTKRKVWVFILSDPGSDNPCAHFRASTLSDGWAHTHEHPHSYAANLPAVPFRFDPWLARVALTVERRQRPVYSILVYVNQSTCHLPNQA